MTETTAAQRRNGYVWQGDDMVAIRADIERTRSDLGDTVAALAARMDLRSRLRGWVRRHPIALTTMAVATTAAVVLLIRGSRDWTPSRRLFDDR